MMVLFTVRVPGRVCDPFVQHDRALADLARLADRCRAIFGEPRDIAIAASPAATNI